MCLKPIRFLKPYRFCFGHFFQYASVLASQGLASLLLMLKVVMPDDEAAPVGDECGTEGGGVSKRGATFKTTDTGTALQHSGLGRRLGKWGSGKWWGMVFCKKALLCFLVYCAAKSLCSLLYN